jgi:hypothetical protein
MHEGSMAFVERGRREIKRRGITRRKAEQMLWRYQGIRR